MSRLANKMRARTGQAVLGPVAPLDGYPVQRTTGPCAGPPMAQPQSWGAACPTGDCSSEDLARNLGRAFAGQRYGCRELGYWLEGTATAGGVVTISQNALVTICPTRVLVVPQNTATVPAGAVMTVFEMGSQNQIQGDPLPLDILLLDSYATIPFVTDCLKAGLPFRIVMTGLTAAAVYSVGLIGPASG